MRNLCAIQEDDFFLEQQHTVSAYVRDSSSELTTQCIVGNDLINIDLSTDQRLWSIPLHIDGTGKQDWCFIAYDTGEDRVLCAATDGHLKAVDCSSQQTNSLGVIDGGICGFSQSPDEAFLVIVSNSGRLLMLTGQGEAILDEVTLTNLSPQGPCGDAQPIVIAWHPSGQAFAMLLTEDYLSQKDRAPLSSTDPGLRTHRGLRLFSTQDIHNYVSGRSEDRSTIAGLANVLAWSGDGSILGVPQSMTDRVQISFFEKNGLRHRELVLPEVDPHREAVVDLAWNLASDLLAVGLKTRDDQCYVQLWYRENYRWYLKWTEYFKQLQLRGLNFDAQRMYRLRVHLETPTGGIMWRSWSFVWEHTISPARLQTAAVIDGKDVHLTALGATLLPPPLTSGKVSCDRTVKAVSFAAPPSSTAASTSMACLSDDGSINIFDEACIVNKASCMPLLTLRPAVGAAEMTWRQMAVLGRGSQLSCLSFLILGRDTERRSDVMLEVRLASQDQQRVAGVDRHVVRITRIQSQPTCCLVELDDGRLMRYEAGRPELRVETALLYEPCPWIDSIALEDDHPSSELVVVALSEKGRLFVGEHLLCASTAAMVISLPFKVLCYVTLGSRPEVHLVSLEEIRTLNASSDSEAAHVQGLEVRALERGSRLVAVSMVTPMLVVQLPRGNLEAVHPRCLVVRAAIHLLQQRQYGDALALLRRHRADLNFIVDYDPARFQADVGLFLSQLASTDHVEVFISSLHNRDSREAQQQFLSAKERLDWQTQTKDDLKTYSNCKVNHVCRLLREHLLRQSDKKAGRMESVLATLARSSPPLLEQALQFIQQNVVTAGRPDERLRQHLLQHLALYADVNTLYNCALGMYDISLARTVARQTQKDPREYLPQLEALQRLPPWRAQIEIDLSLGRPAQALINFANRHESELNHEEVCRVTTSAGLLEKALTLFDSLRFPTLHMKLLIHHAERLHTAHKYRQALLAFMKAGSVYFGRAAESARAEGDWRMAITLATRHASIHPEDASMDVRRLVHSMIDEYRHEMGAGRHERLRHAAQMALEYLSDVDMAVSLLIAGCAWSEAVRYACRASRQDLVEGEIKTGVTVAAETLTAELEERPSRHLDLSGQLCAVLEKQKAQRTEEIREDDVGDDISLMSGTTAASLSSVASLRSNSSLASHAARHSRLTWDGTLSGELRGRGKRGKRKTKIKCSLQDEEQQLRSTIASLCPSRELVSQVAELMDVLYFYEGETKVERLHAAATKCIHVCFVESSSLEDREISGDKGSAAFELQAKGYIKTLEEHTVYKVQGVS